MPIDVSIIIVNYNTKDLTRNCLNSVYEHTKDVVFEIIVSDNGSTDGSVEMIKNDFPQIILIENNANLGFGAANNRAMKIARGKYIFYLNSDTILLNNAVKSFIDYWENSTEKLGALGCVLLDKELKEVTSSANFPTYKREFILLSKFLLETVGIKKLYYKLRHKTSTQKRGVVDFVCGADLFLLNNEMALFDERFFMYFEESDLQYRLKQQGFIAKIIETPRIIHLCGGSEKQKKEIYSFKTKTSMFFWDSCLKYLNKNKQNKFLFCLMKFCIKAIYTNPILFNFYKENKALVTF